MFLKKMKMPIIIFLVIFHHNFAIAACCRNTADNFDQWISDARTKALKKGISKKVVDNIFSNIEYSYQTIELDRKQTAFKLSFEEFIEKISATTIIERGKEMKQKYNVFLKKIETVYGVSPGVLMALWGLESSFGTKKGTIHTLSALATLSHDCRRSKLFTEQFFIAAELVSKGIISADSRGAAHGEIGQFQFLPSNVKKFAVDADKNNKIDIINSDLDAIASAANLLKSNGWDARYGYQPKEKNFKVLRHWNGSMVYRKAIAYVAAHIDGIKIKDGYR